MFKRPRPSIGFSEDIGQYNEPPMTLLISGEFTTKRAGVVVGSPRFNGRVRNVWMSVKNCGHDASNALNISGEVYINGTTCLTTTPKIAAVSGETGAQKTTLVTGDTEIVQANIDESANSYNAGDVITADIALQRTATPGTELAGIVLVVDLLPDFPNAGV